MPAPSILPLINAAGLALDDRLADAVVVPGRRRRDHLRLDDDPLDRRRPPGHRRTPTGPLATTSGIRFPSDVGTTDGTNGGPALAARYSEAFTAYLSDRGEEALGAAYDLGREAVAAQLSVLDLADAHHSALQRRAGRRPRRRSRPRRTSCASRCRRSRPSTAATSRCRRSRAWSTSTSSSSARWPSASVAINSSLTVEAILQLTADTARSILRSARATVAVLAPDPRLRPLTATSPPRLGGGDPQPARLQARLTGRGKELGVLEVIDEPDREFTPRDEAILTQLAQLAPASRSPTPSSTTASARSPARCSARCGPGLLPPVPGLSRRRPLPAGRRGDRARRRLLRPLPRRSTAPGRR